MSIEIVEQDDKYLQFILSDVSIEMANAFRRIILTEIPVMAVDEVIMLRNDSPLYDELLTHRVAMIPLVTDLEYYNFQNECSCGGVGCSLCSVTLTCDITNNSDDNIIVKSGDLVSNDPKIIPVSPNVPIVKMGKDSSLTFEAFAVLGKAKDHVKFQSIAAIGYNFYPNIDIDDEKCKKCVNKCISANFCPKNLFEITKDVRTNKLKTDFWKSCDLCEACARECPEKSINVNWQEDKFVYVIESDGQIPFDMLITKAWEIFVEKIAEFKEQMIELKIEED